MATIHNATARRLMYEWHGGQGSALYAAASSGLVASFAALADECLSIDEPDRNKLLCWIVKRQRTSMETVIGGKAYAILPWVSRTYYPKGK